MAILNSTKVNGQLEADAILVEAASGSTALFVSGNATIKGDLEITGDLTYVGSKDIRVEDKVIEIAYVESGSVTPSEADGAGLVIGNDTNPIASIKYQYNGGGDAERISIDKKIAGSIENADHADKAAQLDNALVFGDGIVVSKGSSFDGSEQIEISVSPEAKIKSAEHADSASKLDHSLTIKGDGVSEVTFDGSANAEVILDLAKYQTVEAAESASVAQAAVNANLLASASAAESAAKAHADEKFNSASAALTSYSASQTTVNANLLASASAAESASKAALAEHVEDQNEINTNLLASASAAESASKAYADQKFNDVSSSLVNYSASQAEINASVSSSVKNLGQRIDTVTGSVETLSGSVAKSIEDVQKNIQTLESGSTEALENYKNEINPYITHVSASASNWDASERNAKEYANQVSASLRTDFANADANVLASMSAAVESASIADQGYADQVSEEAAVRAIASASAAVEGLNYSSSVVENEYVSAVNQEGGVISVEKAAIPVVGVVSGDKILSLDSDRKLHTEISISYNEADRHVYLKGIDNVEISKFDASAFIKDGILYGTALIEATADTETVTIKEQSKEISNLVADHSYMIFCFTNGAAENPEYSWEVLDVTELVDIYVAGAGIQVSGNEISVKLAEGTNFAKIKDGALVVDQVNAANTVITSSIQVAGGPLADDTSNDWPTTWKDEAGNKIIPTDLSVHQILEGLFLKVIDGTVTKKSATTWSPKNTAPALSIKIGAANATSVPVGTMVTASFTANQTVTANSRSVEVSASQGYFLNDDASWVSGSYKQTKTGSKTGTATVVGTFSGSAISSGDVVMVNPGTNKLAVSQSGITASIAKFDDATVYASTNTKVKLAASASIHEDAAPTSKNLTASASLDVTGYFPVFHGQLGNTAMEAADWTADLIKSKSSGSSVPTQVEITTGMATYFIAIPEGHANYSKTVFNVEATSDKSPFGKGKVTSAIAVPMLNDWGNKNYKVFFISNAAAQSANNTFNITFA